MMENSARKRNYPPESFLGNLLLNSNLAMGSLMAIESLQCLGNICY